MNKTDLSEVAIVLSVVTIIIFSAITSVLVNTNWPDRKPATVIEADILKDGLKKLLSEEDLKEDLKKLIDELKEEVK